MLGSAAKILLVRPPSNCVDDDRLEPPLGLLYLAAVLREGGYSNVALADLSGCTSEPQIETCIASLPYADIYGISVVCANHVYAKRCVSQMRKVNPTSYVVAGGANPSALPELSLADLGVDAVVVGEGEDAFLGLVRAYGDGAARRGIVAGKGRSNLDSYPFPARDLINPHSYTKRLMGKPAAPIISSRGCPYHCLHCNSNVMGGGGVPYRQRSADNVAQEVHALVDAGFDYFRFCDDNFTANPQIFELLDRLADCGVFFRIFARADALSEKLCHALRHAGCLHVTMGLESLNPDNLRALGKSSLIGQAQNLALAKAAGLTVRVTFMIGLPYDNDLTIARYFGEAAQLPFDEFEVYPLIPFPGTRLARHPQKWGYRIIADDFRDYLLVGRERKTTFALAHEHFSAADMVRWRDEVSKLLQTRGKVFMRDSVIAR
jgi:anaerobic magnesium-protoporphyrin IX monomethyl ester cyclase